MRVLWVLEDAERPGGVEAVVRSLHDLARAHGVDSAVMSWNPARGDSGATPSSSVGWFISKAGTAIRRARDARRAAQRLKNDLDSQLDLVVVLDPGSLAVARRLEGRPRWGVHLHWAPELLLEPWRHTGGDRIPVLLSPVVSARLHAVARGTRQVLSRAPFLVTLTRSHTVTWSALQPRVHEIPNPVDAGAVLDRGQARPEEEVVLGYVGRLSWEKGPDVLLDAVRLLPPSVGAVRLVVAGAGPAEVETRESARGIDQAQVEFLGWVADVRAVLERVDVLVLPSRTEAVPLVLVEAMAAGCRIVAAEAGSGVRDVLDDGRLGELVPPARPDLMARALERAIAEVRYGDVPDPRLVSAMVARHDPSVVIQRWIDLLGEQARRPVQELGGPS